MNLISRSARILLRSKVRRAINALLYLILLLLILAAGVFSRQASAECARKANTLRDVKLMDRPPTYSTKNGWVPGNQIATIPRGTQILICEERRVGFFGSKQVWFLVKWDAKNGWINGESVEERMVSHSSLSGRLVALLIPTAIAQADSTNNESEDGRLTDPIFIGSFISILAGMVAKSLFDLLRKKRKWLDAKGFAIRLIPSLVISPIAFLGFLRTADIRLSDDLSVLAFFLFAFQNGFFWEDVLNMGQVARDGAIIEKPLPTTPPRPSRKEGAILPKGEAG
jgi:hypothetical protein